MRWGHVKEQNKERKNERTKERKNERTKERKKEEKKKGDTSVVNGAMAMPFPSPLPFYFYVQRQRESLWLSLFPPSLPPSLPPFFVLPTTHTSPLLRLVPPPHATRLSPPTPRPSSSSQLRGRQGPKGRLPFLQERVAPLFPFFAQVKQPCGIPCKLHDAV